MTVMVVVVDEAWACTLATKTVSMNAHIHRHTLKRAPRGQQMAAVGPRDSVTFGRSLSLVAVGA